MRVSWSHPVHGRGEKTVTVEAPSEKEAEMLAWDRLAPDGAVGGARASTRDDPT